MLYAMKARLLPFLGLICLLMSCQKQGEKTQSIQDSITKADSLKRNTPIDKNSLDYIGTYKGILPCDDCEGMETTICINENNTYNIKTSYLGKGDKVFEQKGTFTWNKERNTIVLDNVKNGPNQYFVGKHILMQLDLNGKQMTGNSASQYVLAKQKNTNSEIETLEKSKATVDLNSRMEAQTVIKKVNPAVGKVTLAETKWKLMTLNGKLVKPKGKRDYYIWLNSKDGRFSAFAGCNAIVGNYAMPSSFEISFTEVAMTKMACPDMSVEDRFSTMLESADRYTIADNILQLKKGKKEVLATFEPSK